MLSLSPFTTCYQSLQIVWIQMIVRRFAGPDLGQTSIPIFNLVSACPTYLRRMRTIRWVYSYISKKRKFQTSTTHLPFLQDACSAPFHPCVNLNCQRTYFYHILVLRCALLKHHSLLTVPHITLESRCWLKQYSSSITVC